MFFVVFLTHPNTFSSIFCGFEGFHPGFRAGRESRGLRVRRRRRRRQTQPNPRLSPSPAPAQLRPSPGRAQAEPRPGPAQAQPRPSPGPAQAQPRPNRATGLLWAARPLWAAWSLWAPGALWSPLLNHSYILITIPWNYFWAIWGHFGAVLQPCLAVKSAFCEL